MLLMTPYKTQHVSLVGCFLDYHSSSAFRCKPILRPQSPLPLLSTKRNPKLWIVATQNLHAAQRKEGRSALTLPSLQQPLDLSVMDVGITRTTLTRRKLTLELSDQNNLMTMANVHSIFVVKDLTLTFPGCIPQALPKGLHIYCRDARLQLTARRYGQWYQIGRILIRPRCHPWSSGCGHLM